MGKLRRENGKVKNSDGGEVPEFGKKKKDETGGLP